MENDLEYHGDTMFGEGVSCYLPSDNDDLDDGLVWSK